MTYSWLILNRAHYFFFLFVVFFFFVEVLLYPFNVASVVRDIPLLSWEQALAGLRVTVVVVVVVAAAAAAAYTAAFLFACENKRFFLLPTGLTNDRCIGSIFCFRSCHRERFFLARLIWKRMFKISNGVGARMKAVTSIVAGALFFGWSLEFGEMSINDSHTLFP
jgi:hypothetical protein